MDVDFTQMSEEEILDFLENLTDEEFAALDEGAREFLDKYLEEETSEDEDEVVEEETDEEGSEDEDESDEGDEEGEEEVSEETKSAGTLHPGKGSGGTESKFHTLDTFVRLLQQLGNDDLTNLYNRTVEQIGHEADKVPGSADANRATINAKPSNAVGKGGAKAAMPMPKLSKEDVDGMFPGSELSEEQKEKISAIFEAAVSTRIILETEKLNEDFEAKTKELEEEFESKLEESVNEIAEEMTEKLDGYTNFTVERWMKENELAIENSLRADIAESFITGLHQLFVEHYVQVPETKLDIVADLKEQVDELTAKLNETTDRNIELEGLVSEAAKGAAFEEMTEGLTATQVEKLRTLTEGVEFEDAETYSKKIAIIKENYIKDKSPSEDNKTGLITEEIAGTDESVPEVVIPAGMEKYVKAISKSSK